MDTPQPRKRRRPALSCIECRRRKVKCDRHNPCGQCVAAQSRCGYKTYSGQQIIAHLQRGHASQSTRLNQPASEREQAPARYSSTRGEFRADQPYGAEHGGAAETDNGSRKLTDIARAQSPIQASIAHSTLRDMFQRLQRLEQASKSDHLRDGSETGGAILMDQSMLLGTYVVLNKTKVVRWSSRMGAAKEFRSILACYGEATGNGNGTIFHGVDTRDLLTQVNDLLKKCERLARRAKPGRPTRGLSIADFDRLPLPREQADSMVTRYFQTFELVHRISHRPTFWDEYQRYWSHPESVPLCVRFKVLLVVAIGSSVSARADTDTAFRHSAQQWIYAAQMWLSAALERDWLRITAVQVYCLAILARQIFSVGGDFVWRSMGALINMAMQIGLHRDPSHHSSMSILEAETRRRLWATILEMAVQSSLDSAMPCCVPFDEFDTESPSNIDDDELNESTATLQPQPADVYTMSSIQIYLLKSLPARHRIVRMLNGLHSELLYTEVLDVSSELMDAYRSCSAFMDKSKSCGVTSFHRNLLDHLLRRFIIPLHWPFAIQARTNPLFAFSRTAILDASTAIIHPEPDDGFSRLMAVGGGLFRESLRYAANVISLELINYVETERLYGTLHRDSQFKAAIKQELKVLEAWFLERIRQGETKVKSLMFLRMIIAQAEAIEGGTSEELAIAKNARASLEVCLVLLRDWISTLPLPVETDQTDWQQPSDFDREFDFEHFLHDSDFD
ncbi:hypothetical protein AnigIFM60653_009923 [Aspergillus niger]|nr:hypothetical protein AnigIFM60653_009923 [Aspergillus niger]